MAINCPKCKTRTPLSAEDTGPAGRFVQCPRCGTTWLARHFDVDVYGPQARREPAPRVRQPVIIEGELAAGRKLAMPAGRQRASGLPPPAALSPPIRRGASAGTLGGFAGAAILALALVAVVLLAPAVSALPGLGGAVSGPVVLRAVESRTLSLRGAATLLVEGELYNGSDGEAKVPGVRIALRSADSEVYSWVVEPSRLTVASGAAIGFRSALADPPAGVDRISVTLAERGASLGRR